MAAVNLKYIYLYIHRENIDASVEQHISVTELNNLDLNEVVVDNESTV